MSEHQQRSSAARLLAVVAYPALFAAIVAVVAIFRKPLWELFSAPEALRAWVAEYGFWAPVVFILVQVVQVVIFIIPGEVAQIAAGYLFDLLPGLVLTVVGIALGSSIAFWASRFLGMPFLESILPEEQIKRIARISESPRALMTFFLFFLIPGVPKDILCYVGGLSRLRFPLFLVASTIGRLPGIVGSVIMGDAAAEQRWLLAAIVLGGAVILFLLGVAFRERIVSWLERYSAAGEREATPNGGSMPRNRMNRKG